MHFVLDMREQELHTQMRILCSAVPAFHGVEIRVANLPLGDAVVMEEEQELLIVERKCLADLLASIRDGRYEEQSYRLSGLESIHNHNVMYLVEGDLSRMNGNRFKPSFQSDKLTLYSAVFSLNYYKGFSVMRTMSLEESAFFLCNTLVKMKKEKLQQTKHPYYVNGGSKQKAISEPVEPSAPEADQQPEGKEEKEEAEATTVPSDKDYVSVVKKVKKENINNNNMDEIMLCQVPGISAVTASAILEKYKSLRHLLNELEASRAAGNETVEDITYTNAKGQVRRINRTTMQNLFKYLCRA